MSPYRLGRVKAALEALEMEISAAIDDEPNEPSSDVMRKVWLDLIRTIVCDVDDAAQGSIEI